MADSAIADIPVNPTKKKAGKNSRKALKQKNTNLPPPAEESDVSAQKPSPMVEQDPPAKENDSVSAQPKKGRSKGKAAKQQPSGSSFEKEMQEMQEMMEKLKIEKERTEELLKERDDMLRQKEEELESKGREQEKLHTELKKLQKLKEFKPTVTFPIAQAMNDKEQDKKEKKKKGCSEVKRPSTPYILWCKDQWGEVNEGGFILDRLMIRFLVGS